ncbi:MAG: TAXI family TRAP transporter solute-binding subunit [Planctomycetota bacterium]
MARVTNASWPRVEIEVTTSAGSLENRARLASAEADLGLIQNDAEPHREIRCLVPLHLELFHFFANAATDISRVRDLIGKRVVIGAPDSGTRRLAYVLFDHYHMSVDQLEVVDASPEKAIDLMREGQLDALFHVGDMTSELSEQLLQEGIARLVSFGEDAAWENDVRSLIVQYPFLEAATIPRHLYMTPQGQGNPERAIHTFGLRSMLVCRRDLPQEDARQIVEAIFTHRGEVMQDCPAAREIAQPMNRERLHFQLHPGAVAYYDRHQPGFLERYAETIALMLTVGAGGWALLVAASGAMGVRKKNRIDRYYVRLSQIIERLNASDLDVDQLDALHGELNRLRANAIDELTRERLKADESFRIFQSLLSDCQTQATIQRHRLEALSRPVL